MKFFFSVLFNQGGFKYDAHVNDRTRFDIIVFRDTLPVTVLWVKGKQQSLIYLQIIFNAVTLGWV